MLCAVRQVIVAALSYISAPVKRTLQPRLELLHGPILSTSRFSGRIVDVLTVRECANHLLVDVSMTCPRSVLVIL